MKELVFKNEEGLPVTSSLLVAQKFGKRHGDVLRVIRDLEADVAEISGNECKRNFAFTSQMVEQPNGGWREESYYLINRDGFSLLVMGFTGKDALRFKLSFIESFNRMETQLKEGYPSREALYEHIERYIDGKLGNQHKTAVSSLPPLDVHEDLEAYRYFDSYQTTDGVYLDKCAAREYYANACVLNALSGLLKQQYGVRGYSRKYSQTLFWHKAVELVRGVEVEKFPHTLPDHPRKLRAKYMNYFRSGYKSLIHKGIGNHNAKRK
jgi:Rha family phage regulatory protein